MLSSISPNFSHIIALSNTAQSAKTNALKCLKCPSVQVCKFSSALSVQVNFRLHFHSEVSGLILQVCNPQLAFISRTDSTTNMHIYKWFLEQPLVVSLFHQEFYLQFSVELVLHYAHHFFGNILKITATEIFRFPRRMSFRAFEEFLISTATVLAS